MQGAVVVPADAVRMTSKFLRSVTRLESCCFWLGRRATSGPATVEAVVVPRQKNHPTHYHVEPDAMLGVAAVARPRGWTNLAQIHSHPGVEVGHSEYDDDMANSRRALSLIYPRYGSVRGMWRFHGWLWRLWPRAFPDEIGVHAFTDNAWALLPPPDVNCVLQLTHGPAPAFIDLRR